MGSNVKIEKFTSIALVACGIIIPILTLHIGICEFDEFYQILCAQYYADQPLAPLSFYMANLWSSIFGDYAMSYRYFTYFINTLTIAIPVLYYYNSTHKKLQSSYIFLILQLCYNMFMTSFFNWDVCSNLFITSSVCVIMSYYKTQSLKHIIGMAALASCATLSRMPNISLVAITILLALYINKSIKTKLGHTIIYLLTYSLVYLIIVFVIFGGVSEYIISWNSDNIITGHSSIWSIFGWLNGAPQRELPCLFMAVTMFAMVYVLHKREYLYKKKYFLAIILFWWGYLSLVAFTKKLPFISPYPNGIYYLIIIITLFYAKFNDKLTIVGG